MKIFIFQLENSIYTRPSTLTNDPDTTLITITVEFDPLGDRELVYEESSK